MNMHCELFLLTRNTTKSSLTLSVAAKHTHPQRLHASVLIQSTSRTNEEIRADLARPMYRKDIFYSGSVYNIAEYRARRNSNTGSNHIATSAVSIPGSEASRIIWWSDNIDRINIEVKHAIQLGIDLKRFMSFLRSSNVNSYIVNRPNFSDVVNRTNILFPNTPSVHNNFKSHLNNINKMKTGI